MATCATCGTQIEVPEGWSVGASVRRHYWAEHPDRMLRRRADRAAEEVLPGAPGRSPATGATTEKRTRKSKKPSP